MGGRFYTGCDMGITVDDLVFMRAFTPHPRTEADLEFTHVRDAWRT